MHLLVRPSDPDLAGRHDVVVNDQMVDSLVWEHELFDRVAVKLIEAGVVPRVFANDWVCVNGVWVNRLDIAGS